MTEMGQNDPTLKAERGTRPKRSGNVKAKAEFMKAIHPKVTLPAQYGHAAKGNAANGHPQVSDAERERRTAQHTAELQARSQKMLADEKAQDDRKRHADHDPLLKRYHDTQALVARVIFDVPSKGPAADILRELTQRTGFQVGNPPASRKIEANLKKILASDDGLAIVDVQVALEATGDLLKKYVNASLDSNTGPGFSETLCTAVQASAGDIANAAKRGMAFYETCLQNEALMQKVATLVERAQREEKIFADLVEACGEFATLMRLGQAEMASMEASAAVFGPAGPGVLCLLIVAEVFAGLAGLMRAIGRTIELIENAISGQTSIPGDYYKLCDAFSLPKKMVHEIEENLRSVQKDFEGMKKAVEGLRKLADRMRAYLKHK